MNGDNATGRITSGSDPDVFAVVLDDDHQYRIEVWGDDSTDDGGTLNDPKVMTLLNPSFDPLTNPRFIEETTPHTYNQVNRGGIHDDNSGSGNNALLEVANHWAKDIHYIQVASADGGNGTYTVKVTLTGTDKLPAPRNLRPFLPAGHNYLPTVSEPPGEDLPQIGDTKGRAEPIGTRAHGNISPLGDADTYKLDMIPGYSYRIDMKGAESSALGGTLGDPVMQLGDSNGAIPVDATHVFATKGQSDSDLIGDDDSGDGENASFEVNVFGKEDYRLAVWESGDNATGTYTVQSTLLGPHGHLFRPEGTQETVSEPARRRPV